MGTYHKSSYKLLLWKAYFEKGWQITNYFKYVLVVFGWATNDVKTTILIGIVWVLCCFIVGKFWYKYKLINTEQEIQNRINPFVHEMRSNLKTKRFK